MSYETIRVGQLICDSTTPPEDRGFYKIDEKTTGVVGDLVFVHPVSGKESVPVHAVTNPGGGDRIRIGDRQIALASAQFGSLINATAAAVTYSASNPSPCLVQDGVVIAQFSSKFYAKTDANGLWAEICAAPESSVARKLLPTYDGEMLFISTSKIYKSAGWPSAGTTWYQKVANTGGNAVFTGFSGYGDGVKFAVSEYATGGAGVGWQDSQKVYATTDGGNTWSVIYDTSEMWGAAAETNSHIHSAAYDPIQDVWLVCEGHSTGKGLYWSPATLSPTWTKIGGEKDFFPNGGAPTCMVPSAGGIILASDNERNGVYVIKRGAQPSDMTVVCLWEWGTAAPQIAGFGSCYVEYEGAVVFGWTTNNGYGAPLLITASDGITAAPIYVNYVNGPVSASATIERIVITPWGTMIAAVAHESGNLIVTGDVRGVFGSPVATLDSGNVLGGLRTGYVRSLAVGPARAGTDSVAVGAGAVADSIQTLQRSVAVGVEAKAGYRSVAVGRSANADGNDRVAIGDASVAGSSSTAVGYTAITGAQCVAVGKNSNAGNNGTVIGYGATSSASGDAIGENAKGQHTNGVAIGRNTQTARTNSVAFGDRDIELQGNSRGVILRSPNGTLYKLTVSDAGAVTVTAVA